MKTPTRLLSCLALAACSVQEPTTFRLAPVCVDDGDVPADAWTCSEALVIDCNDGEVPDEIFVTVDDGTCDDLDLQPVDGPFPPGHYDIVVVDGNSDAAVCTTELTVTDEAAPEVHTEDLSMWPPNHKMHDFVLGDCITEIDDCDADWTAAIDYVSSDEPENEQGDGNTEADIVLTGPDALSLRSERQGGSNGRVYTVGFTVTDGSGNETEAQCRVIVDHDQGNGAAIDDGEAYRVEP